MVKLQDKEKQLLNTYFQKYSQRSKSATKRSWFSWNCMQGVTSSFFFVIGTFRGIFLIIWVLPSWDSIGVWRYILALEAASSGWYLCGGMTAKVSRTTVTAIMSICSIRFD
jgi:hypothetical protein